MKKIFKFNIIGIFLVLLSVSCSKSEPIGEWDDIIKISEKEIEISSENNSILITTQGKWWWIYDINLNGNHIDFSNINTTRDNFIIERINKTEIHIDMYENTTGSIRVLNIGLEAGDYFDNIKITQLSN